VSSGFKADVFACAFLVMTLQLYPLDFIQLGAEMYGRVGIWVQS
jgi:hypothetical protein